MQSRLNVRARHNTAWLVLLVWLFALSVGVANACLLERPAISAHAAAGKPSATTFTSALVSADAPDAAAHDDPQASGDPCAKVCDDNARSLPKLPASVDHTDPDAAPLVAILWSLTAPVVMVRSHPSDKHAGIPELPIRVRYTRLTL